MKDGRIHDNGTYISALNHCGWNGPGIPFHYIPLGYYGIIGPNYAICEV